MPVYRSPIPGTLDKIVQSIDNKERLLLMAGKIVIDTNKGLWMVSVCECVRVCMRVCMYVCVYVCV